MRQDQSLGLDILFLTSTQCMVALSQKCRMIGHCNETTWNIGLKLHKAPLIYICSSYAELYCLDRPGKNRLFFVSRKLSKTVFTKQLFNY